MLLDLRRALRSLAKSPGFTALALLTLALGIGATATVFSGFDALLLRPLALPAADRLLLIWSKSEKLGWDHANVSFEDAASWREARAFSAVGIFGEADLTLTGRGEAQLLAAVDVTPDYFRVLRVQPARGRLIEPGDGVAGAAPVAVLSDACWRKRFGSDPAVLGHTIMLDGVAASVVGVMPAGFDVPGWEWIELWKPLPPPIDPRGRGHRSYKVLARLADGVTVPQARAELDAISTRLAAEFPNTNLGRTANAVPLAQDLFDGDFRLTAHLVFGAVGLVLLIGCANVANLLLARSAGREGEMAIRAALGASSTRLVRLLLTEAALLAAGGGALGLLAAYWGTDVLIRLLPASLPRVGEIRLDWRVAVFALAASVVATLASGLWPALQSARISPAEPLREASARTSGGQRRRRAQAVLVASEVALAVVLLSATGLIARTLLNLRRVDPGFDTARGVTARLTLPASRYPEATAAAAFFERLRERLEAIPGVVAAGAVNYLPLAGTNSWLLVTVEGRPVPPPGEETRIGYVVATPGYFEAMAVERVVGRALAATDTAGTAPVAVVNERLARQLWPGESAVGKRLRRGREDRPDRPWLEIVGVVRDVHHQGLRTPPRPELYLPLAQQPERSMDLVVRGASPDAVSVAAIQQAMGELDPALALARPRPLREVLDDQTSTDSAFASLLGAFALAALGLSVLGLYGVVALAVGQTSREIGIRVALGASPAAVIGHVLRRWLKVTGLGIAAGLAGALVLGRTLQSLLFGVGAADPSTLAGVTALLAGVAVAASLLPALRAGHVDPATVLRVE